jgi:hypothetical protein
MKRLLLFGFLFAMVASVIISCQKELSYEGDQNLGHGTLYDSNKSCRPIVQNGTFYNGVSAARDTNFVKVIVTVTQTGSYTLSTDSVNGFGFRTSGFFTKLGDTTINLQAFGTPILDTTTDFTIILDSSTCGFTIHVQDSTGTGLGGNGGGVNTSDSSFEDPNPAPINNWHFTDSNSLHTYSGIFDITNTANPQGGFISLNNDTLTVVGQASTTDTAFGFQLTLPSGNLTPGKYPITGENFLVLLEPSNTTDAIYYSDSTSASEASANGNSYITITSNSNNQLAGYIHVYAQRYDGELVLIAGSFNCRMR